MNGDHLAYRQLLKGDEQRVSELIEAVFDEFIAPDYESGGIEEFRKHIVPHDILGRHMRGDSFVLVVEEAGEMVGVIDVRDGSHIRLFFVRKERQGRGIGRKLFELAVDRCRQEDHELTAITVNSSPYAVPIYESLGFVVSHPEQVKNGIRHTPMTCRFPKRSRD
jgi:GNAT superfamily N-acetyltransferase